MEYLHLITDKMLRELVQHVAQNDPTKEILCDIGNGDADAALALGHALIGNTFLSELYLTNLVLTEEAAHALAQGIAHSKIKVLYLDGDCQELPSSLESSSSSSSAHQGRICDIFYRGIQASTSIQEIVLNQFLTHENPGIGWKDALLGVASIKISLSANSYVGYAEAFSDVLSRTTALRELHVQLEGMQSDGIIRLAHGLRQNTSITMLWLGNFEIMDNRQRAQLLFAQGLNPNSAITKLCPVTRLVDDDCIELLLHHWLPNCSLKELILQDNKIGPTGAQHLMQAIANHPTILALDLSSNYSIGYKGLCLIGNELANLHHLTNLNLECCFIYWDNNVEAESEEAQTKTRARQQAGQALLDGMKRNCSITTLRVDSNGFPQHVTDEICFYAALNATGRYLLSADGNYGLSPSVWCDVFVKCQRQPKFGTSLVYFYLKELPTLVQSRSLLERKRCWEK